MTEREFVPPSNCVVVLTIAGEAHTIEMHPGSNIGELLPELQKKGYPDLTLENYKRTFHLRNEETDEECKGDDLLVHGSMLKLVSQELGGFFSITKFTDLNNRVEVKLRQYNPAATYLIVKKGISFRTTCKTPTCVAYQKTIYINRGFGVFRVPVEVRRLKCPICNQKADPALNCGFFKAKYKIKGFVDGEDDYRNDGIEHVEDKDTYCTFKEGETLDWVELEITVTELNS